MRRRILFALGCASFTLTCDRTDPDSEVVGRWAYKGSGTNECSPPFELSGVLTVTRRTPQQFVLTMDGGELGCLLPLVLKEHRVLTLEKEIRCDAHGFLGFGEIVYSTWTLALSSGAVDDSGMMMYRKELGAGACRFESHGRASKIR